MTELNFAAVFRRLSLKPITMEWLSVNEMKMFVYNFVKDFVPDCLHEMLAQCLSQKFAQEGSTWGTRSISIDMVKQYLMKRLTSFRTKDGGGLDKISLHKEELQRLVVYICDEQPAIDHLMSYPVQ